MKQERPSCNLCFGLLSDIEKETGKFRRDFEQIVKNLDCKDHYLCLPLLKLREKNERKP